MGSPPLGITPQPAALLDDRTRPDFRDVFGTLASQSTDIATAITRVRLSTMNLTESELRSVLHFRVLVAEMNAIQLTAEARGLVNDPARAPRLPLLQRMLESGRLQVRAAPLAGWSPDFTVFADLTRPSSLELVEVSRHCLSGPSTSARPGERTVHPFSLIFRQMDEGPALEQATYHFRRRHMSRRCRP